MSFDPIDLADLHHLPWTNPAPTGGDKPDTGPCVLVKACGCGVLAGESCDCADLAAQLEAHLARPIWFGRRAA